MDDVEGMAGDMKPYLQSHLRIAVPDSVWDPRGWWTPQPIYGTQSFSVQASEVARTRLMAAGLGLRGCEIQH